MGTSTNYSASPNWGPVKQQTTQIGGEGLVTPEKAQTIVSAVVSQMTIEPQLGFGAPLSSGGGDSRTSGHDEASGSNRSGANRKSVGGVTRTGGGSIRTVARGLGSFLADVTQKGFQQALAERGLTDLAGKSADEVALELADLLGGPASLIEETLLRDALIDVVMEWSDEKDSIDELGEHVESISKDIDTALHDLMGHYVYQVFKTIGYQGVLQNHGFEKANGMANQIRDYIGAKISELASSRDLSSIEWNGREGADLIDSIVGDTVELFGGPEE